MNYIEEIQRVLEQLSLDTNADFEQIKNQVQEIIDNLNTEE
jgi:hypothetical protein